MNQAEALVLVNKLINLAGSNAPEEARTAALAACRLIKEHHLEVVPAKPQPAHGNPFPPEETRVEVSDMRNTVNSFFDMLETLTGAPSTSGSQGSGGNGGRGGGR
jgi:hypothetical protein